MPRTKFNVEKETKLRKSFSSACKQSEEGLKEGKYRAVIRSLEERVKCYEVTSMIFDLKEGKNLGFAKAFLPLSYHGGDITEQFFQTFDNPEFVDEVIGKEACVEIKMYESESGKVYPNVISFAKM